MSNQEASGQQTKPWSQLVEEELQQQQDRNEQQRVQPTSMSQQVFHNDKLAIGSREQNPDLQSAKMLIFLQNGEQRLIKFTLPKKSCTLQEILEQVCVPFTADTHIQCMQNRGGSEIDYYVSVGNTTSLEELLENHPVLLGEDTSSSSTSSGSREGAQVEPQPCLLSPPPRFVSGHLALCKACGFASLDFSRCQRCRRVFTEEPKRIPANMKNAAQKKELKRTILKKKVPCAKGKKGNFIKNATKTVESSPASETEPANICRICYESTFDHVFVPCGHTICETCANRILEDTLLCRNGKQTCPSCRTRVDRVIQIYF